MNVAEVMSTPAITVSPNDTLETAVEVMLSNTIGCVVVVDHGVVGILTRSDVLKALTAQRATLTSASVESGMSHRPITITPEVSVETALRTMEEAEVKKLPVVADLELVGIITMTDIARQLPARVQEARRAFERREEWAG